MRSNLRDFTIGIETDLVTAASANFRPPSWPPPHDWPVVIDKDVVSRWGDPIWDLTPWRGRRGILNFGDGKDETQDKVEPLDTANADIMRMIATWFIWGPRAYRSAEAVLTSFSLIRQIIALCSRNNISASRLMRYPNVFEQVPGVIATSAWTTVIPILHRLYDDRDTLGFTIINPVGLKRLANAAPDHEAVQTPYMPPRIWLYQVTRLRECMMDFQDHRKQIEECFRFCLDAYIATYGSLEAAVAPGKHLNWAPFRSTSRNRDYQGKFSDTAARFGIADLLAKWVRKDPKKLTVRSLSTYFSLVSYAGLAYVANFTLQRAKELASLRTSCLLWEEDEQLGRVPIICGETTKTDPDSDARWVASPSVEVAVQAVSAIAQMRMVCARANPLIQPTEADQDDPLLLSRATEPWSTKAVRPYRVRLRLKNLDDMRVDYPLLFDPEQLKISTADLEVALRLTPNLSADVFAVGKVWPLNWHQCRRTGTVNMFASGTISNSTMQQQLKHSSRLMPLYYGRNHSRLHLNREAAAAVLTAMYQSHAETVKQVATGDRFVTPVVHERKAALVVNILSAKDNKDLVAMAKKGTVAFREHRLGGCMKAGVCEYGGIESVARCAGGDGGKPCTDVLYDRKNEPQLRADLRRVTEEIKMLPVGSPRYNRQVAERRGLENALNVLSTR
ncbi:hypothetical protein [Noviherbaspirillum sp. Root189]|uniref:hypothetical protein n=1 Tax=Noviherbaspirillum sp. Root189 TaxID=1736487 RepID=UPI00070C5E79|nr:hypothetical protein [Noviherbaspirillum sp. Root189]KRB75756.1 hypothetical protein ASE07_26465 [Noviherbaspirillum sp. Root189]